MSTEQGDRGELTCNKYRATRAHGGQNKRKYIVKQASAVFLFMFIFEPKCGYSLRQHTREQNRTKA